MSNIIKNKFFELYNEDKFPHCFLIETNNVDMVCNDLIEFICSIEDERSLDSIRSNNNPGLMIIDASDNVIKKDAVENLKQNFSTIPVFTINNYYIIKFAEKMNLSSYNKLLKFLEEPQDRIYGFLVTSNRSKLPDTIISRCETCRVFYDNTSVNNDEISIVANEFIRYIKNHNNDILCYNDDVVINLLCDKSKVILFLNFLLTYYLHNKDHNNIKFLNIIKKYIEIFNYNVNLNLFLNSFAIEMVDAYE